MYESEKVTITIRNVIRQKLTTAVTSVVLLTHTYIRTEYFQLFSV